MSTRPGTDAPMPSTPPNPRPGSEHAERLPHKRVDVFTRRWGQPRAYADSIYEADLVFYNWYELRQQQALGTWCPGADEVKQYAKILVHHFRDPAEGMHPQLTSCTQINERTWRVVITAPYCD